MLKPVTGPITLARALHPSGRCSSDDATGLGGGVGRGWLVPQELLWTWWCSMQISRRCTELHDQLLNSTGHAALTTRGQCATITPHSCSWLSP